MILFFSISLLGHVIICRILSFIACEFAFSQQWIRKFSLLNLAMLAFCMINVGSAASLWLFIGILFITLKFFSPLLRIFLQKRLRQALIPLFDCLILNLQAGHSFRSSFRMAIDIQSGWVRLQLLELYESMLMSKNVIATKSALMKDLQVELMEVDQSSARCLEQIRTLRRGLKMQEDFRRRSGQITQQIKMQAIIVTALYVALLIFVIMQFGYRRYHSLILMSFLIFVAGLIWIFAVGRRMKWKV